MVRVWISETSRTTKRKVTMVIIPRSTTNFLVHKNSSKICKEISKKFCPLFRFQHQYWRHSPPNFTMTNWILAHKSDLSTFTPKCLIQSVYNEKCIKNVSITKNSSRPPHHNVLKKLQKVSFYNIFPPKIKVTFLARKFKVTNQRTFCNCYKVLKLFFLKNLVQNFNFEKND